MILRYGAAIGFIATIGFITVATVLLGQYPSSTFLWWVNQELYCPFRQIFYFIDEAPQASAITAIAAAAVVWFFHRRGKKDHAAFLLNNGLLLLVLATEFARWKAGPFASLSSVSASSYLHFVLAINLPAALAISALGVSSVVSHYRCLFSMRLDGQRSNPTSSSVASADRFPGPFVPSPG